MKIIIDKIEVFPRFFGGGQLFRSGFDYNFLIKFLIKFLKN